jgi:multiple sugar transport system ATP-binding protein
MAVTGIVLAGIGKRFGPVAALAGVSLEVAAGEFVALVGPSGCGKSTLMRVVAGIEAPDEGEVRIGGRDVTRLRPAERDVAMVFQSYALYPHLTARQNIAVPILMRGKALHRTPLLGRLLPEARRTRAAIAAEVERISAPLGLTALLDRRPAQLSGGQRQRVALARAVVRRPAAFLMDEPLSNLDAALRVQTRREIVEIHRRAGAATLYVTHDQEEALTMADRVAVMMAGEVLQVAAPEAIYADPTELRVAGFIGSPRINTLAAEAGAEGGGAGRRARRRPHRAGGEARRAAHARGPAGGAAARARGSASGGRAPGIPRRQRAAARAPRRAGGRGADRAARARCAGGAPSGRRAASRLRPGPRAAVRRGRKTPRRSAAGRPGGG